VAACGKKFLNNLRINPAMLGNILLNKIFLAGAISWVIAQLLKFVIDGIRTKKFHPKLLLLPGKMPSSHTATIVSVTAMIYLLEGISDLFMLALFVSFIIMYDCVTSRRQVGIITQTLNATLKKKIRYFEGHTPLQVLAGAVIGICVALVISWIL
jgi:hypothetical protein